jgi:hypothetical protein
VGDKLSNVLQEDEAWSHVSNDLGDRRPEPAVISNSLLPTRSREGLAWESGSDQIHLVAPRSAVEGCEIVPHRRRIQSRFFHPCHENGRRVGVPLTTTHGSYVESVGSAQLPEGKLEASEPVAEAEGM